MFGLPSFVERRDLDFVLHFLCGLPEFLGSRHRGKERVGRRLDLAVDVDEGGQFLDDRQGLGAAAAHIFLVADKHQFADVELIEPVKAVDVARLIAEHAAQPGIAFALVECSCR